MTAVARTRERRQAPQPHDATSLSVADDRIRQSDWLPPQDGIIPRIRLGGRSINLLWAIPLSVVLLVLGIAVAQQLRTMPGVEQFVTRYPGATPFSEAVYSGFPLWLRLLHFFNFFLICSLSARVSRFSPIIRVFIGGETAHPAQIGSASNMTFRKTAYGRQKTIP